MVDEKYMTGMVDLTKSKIVKKNTEVKKFEAGGFELNCHIGRRWRNWVIIVPLVWYGILI